MRIGILSSMMALLVGMGTALAQPPGSPDASAVPAVTIPPTVPTIPVPATAGPGPGGNLPSSWAADPAGNETVVPDPALPVPAISDPFDSSRLYGRFEYILWKLQGAPTPITQLTVPYTTTGLNQVQTTISLGGANIDLDGRSGGRLTVGGWLDADHELGLEASYFQLESRQAPFVNVNQSNLPLTVTVIQNIPQQLVVGTTVTTQITQVPIVLQLPAVLTVSAIGSTGNSSFWGTEANARTTCCHFGGLSFDLLAGLRYLTLREQFSMGETVNLTIANPNVLFSNGPVDGTNPLTGAFVPVPSVPAAISGLNTVATITNLTGISTHNDFYAGQVGTSWDWAITNRLNFSGFGKIAVGAMTEGATIATSTTTVGSAAGTTNAEGQGGILPYNGILEFDRTHYAVAPELNMNFGYRLTSHLRVLVGYNFLYLSSVARPGDQLQYGTATSQLGITGSIGTTGASSSANTNVGASSAFQNISSMTPQFTFKDTSFWAQGLTFSLEVRY